jgi:hypothetical protein
MVRNSEKKMHAMRGSKDLYSRILGGIGKGSEGQIFIYTGNLFHLHDLAI